MPIDISFSQYGSVPLWSPAPPANYRVTIGQALSPVPPQIYRATATWNLYWAFSPRITGTVMVPLREDVVPHIDSVLKFSFRLKPTNGSWTLAALMCALPRDEYLKQYGPAIAALLNVPLPQDVRT